MKLKRFAVGLVLIPLAAAGLAVAANVFGDAKPATARFHHVHHAVAAGYGEFRDAQGIACIELPGTGAMGVHYVNGSLVGDAVLDTSRPEALVYERRGQNLHLVAVEYIVFQSVWEEPEIWIRPGSSAANSTSCRAEPVRVSAVLRAPRVGLEGQSQRRLLRLESKGGLLRG